MQRWRATLNKPELQLQTAPLAQAGAGFRSGGGALWSVAVAGVCVLLGLWLWLSHNDEARVYGELGRKLNGVRQLGFDAFWQCVLEDVDLSAVRSNTELLHWLGTSVEAGGPEYAAHLRDDCMVTLNAITPGLEQVIAPDDLKSDIASMQAATQVMQRDFRDVISCLSRGENICPRAALEPELQGIARGWFDFHTAHAAINRTIRGRLEKP
jgi:hypothetical protein